MNNLSNDIKEAAQSFQDHAEGKIQLVTHTTPAYDSRQDTLTHIDRVQRLMLLAVHDLAGRAARHDQSKLEEPEKSLFDIWTPRLKGMTYGSEEYKESLAALKPALDHHYANNSHHPEFHQGGVVGMTLLDLLEMLCDWKAAGERHADGSMVRSMEMNEKRFNIPPALMQVLWNTVKELQEYPPWGTPNHEMGDRTADRLAAASDAALRGSAGL